MNKTNCLQALLVAVACVTLTSCSDKEEDMVEPGPYGAQVTRVATHQGDIIEIDENEGTSSLLRYKVKPIAKDELFALLQTGGWAETEVYGLYPDGHLTENLLWVNENNRFKLLAFDHEASALLCSPFYGKQQIRFSYKEEHNLLFLSNIQYPGIIPKGEEDNPDYYFYEGETYAVLSISEKELLLIGHGAFEKDAEVSTPAGLHVFTHVPDAEVEKWRIYY